MDKKSFLLFIFIDDDVDFVFCGFKNGRNRMGA